MHEQGHDEHGSKRAQIRSDGNGHEQGYGHGHDGHDDSTLLDAAAVAHAFMRDPRRLKAAAGASLASQNVEAAIHGYPQTEVIVPASEENPVHGRTQVTDECNPAGRSASRAEDWPSVATAWSHSFETREPDALYPSLPDPTHFQEREPEPIAGKTSEYPYLTESEGKKGFVQKAVDRILESCQVQAGEMMKSLAQRGVGEHPTGKL